MTLLTRVHTAGTCVSGETAFPLDHAWACRPGTREQRAARCGRASQPWEETCLLGEQGSPQRTVQGSRATVDAVSHLGPSDKDRGLGNVKKRTHVASGQRWPVCCEEGFEFSPFLCPRVCLSSLQPCVVSRAGPSAGLCLFSFTPRGFSFNSECAPGCDRHVLTRGPSRNAASAGSAGS